MTRHPLRFRDLRVANLVRCLEVFHALEDWSPTDWGTAVAGEVGEALNLVKKLRRGEPVARNAIAAELADAVIYIDLLCARLGIDLGRAVAYKFNRVSERRGATKMLLYPDHGSACPMGNLSSDRVEDDESAIFDTNTQADSHVSNGAADAVLDAALDLDTAALGEQRMGPRLQEAIANYRKRSGPKGTE